MRRTFAVVPKRRAGHSRSIQRNNISQNANGMMSYSSLVFVLGIVALTTSPFHQAIPRILSRLTNSPRPDNFPSALGGEITFLLGIFSPVGSESLSFRESVRQQYLELNDPRLCNIEEFFKQSEDSPYQRVCQVPYTFVIAGGGDHRPTDHNDDEPLIVDTDHNGFSDAQGDCTYLNVKESAEVGKSATWFKYASSIADKYGIDFIAKVDDQSIIIPDLFFEFLGDLQVPPFNQQIYGGVANPGYHQEVLYGSGEFYFMSTDLAYSVGNKVSRITSDMEDVDIGTFISTSPRPIKFIDLHRFQFWSKKSKTPWDFISSREVGNNNKKLSIHKKGISWWSNCPEFV